MTTAKLIAELSEQGWRVEQARNGYKAMPPDRTRPMVFVSTHGVEQNGRGAKNLLSDLRRSGFQWPPPETPRPEPPPKDIMPPKTNALEELFAELKDARDYLVLAAEAHEKAKSEAEAAIAKRDAAATDVEKARGELAAAKKRFDKMCGID